MRQFFFPLLLLLMVVFSAQANPNNKKPSKFYRKLFLREVIWFNPQDTAAITHYSENYKNQAIGILFGDHKHAFYPDGKEAQYDYISDAIVCTLQKEEEYYFFFTKEGKLMGIGWDLPIDENVHQLMLIEEGTPDFEKYLAEFKQAFPQVKRFVK